jgi:DNA mismatch repair protein MutS2
MDFSLRPLEYDQLKTLLGRYIVGEGGRSLITNLVPITDRASLEAQHALNREAMEYLRDHRVSFPDLPLVPVVVGKVALAGTTLEIPEIEAVQNFLSLAESFRKRIKGEVGEFPLLAARAALFPDLGALERHLARAVRGGEVNESYSPELKRLRRALESSRSRLNHKLESILKSPVSSSQLQDQLITVRNGRYVIPVRAEQKRTFEGIIHGASSSGATVFMEPLETLDLNNDIVRLEEEEKREIHRILSELTGLIHERRDDLDHATILWSEMEFVFGKGQFGRDFDCVGPIFSEGRLELVGARHPLLEASLRSAPQQAVPLNLEMDEESRVLIISGPNAGGKTVLLKTLGLLTLMAQSGIPLPAQSATLPIMDRVLADIGDQQSITNQLSTFSAHIVAIKSMVERASEKSVILLDEIGSSTEPGEGAALAIAVLDHFRRAGCLTLASTHYNRLKMYAETTEGVRNSAMEFNEGTLEPTYRLIRDLSGSSSGLKIAERFHMPEPILAFARDSLDSSELEAARYVEELRSRIQNLEGEKAELESEKSEFEDWKGSMTRKLEAERADELERVRKKLDSIVAEIRDRATEDLRALGRDAVKRFDRKMDNARARADLEIRREQSRTALARTIRSTPPPDSVEVGAQIQVLSLGVRGSVLRVLKREVEVTVGNMKMRLPFNDIEVVGPPRINLPKGVHFDFSGKELETNELNLIGCRADEALSRLDKFLDDAFLAGVATARIIHGSGMGVLRKAVAEFLESHPQVSGFEAAPSNQGGGGVTTVTLRD